MKRTENNSTAIIWSINNCPYCSQAKNFLKQKGIMYEERNLHDGTWTKAQLLESVPNARTVPQIFLDDKYIGGYDKLVEYFKKDNK